MAMPYPLFMLLLSGCSSLAKLCGTLAWTILQRSWLVRRTSSTPSMCPLGRGLASPSLTQAPRSSLSSCTRRSTRLGGCGHSQRARRLLQERRDSLRLQGAPRRRALRVRAPANRFPRLLCTISGFVYVILRLWGSMVVGTSGCRSQKNMDLGIWAWHIFAVLGISFWHGI